MKCCHNFVSLLTETFSLPARHIGCRAHHAVRSYSAPIGWLGQMSVLLLVRKRPCDRHTAFHLIPATRATGSAHFCNEESQLDSGGNNRYIEEQEV